MVEDNTSVRPIDARTASVCIALSALRSDIEDIISALCTPTHLYARTFKLTAQQSAFVTTMRYYSEHHALH
eukprot:14822-Heterococcus_DN1.PRE.4